MTSIRELTQFLALAEHLHFGRASQASHISVSALSRNIRQLEEALDSTLFYRDNRSVSLSKQGHIFSDYAREAVKQWNRLQIELSAAEQKLHGQISVYCSVTASYSILFDLLNTLRNVHPQIEIKLHTGDADDALGRILDGSEDIAITAKPDRLVNTLEFYSIKHTDLLFIAAKNSLFAEKADNFAALIKDSPMILPESGLARSRLDKWFKARTITPKIYAQVSGYEAIVSMVSLGLGIGVVPEIVLDHSPMKQQIIKIKPTPALQAFDVGVMVKKRSLKNPLVNAFLAEAQAKLRA